MKNKSSTKRKAKVTKESESRKQSRKRKAEREQSRTVNRREVDLGTPEKMWSITKKRKLSSFQADKSFRVCVVLRGTKKKRRMGQLFSQLIELIRRREIFCLSWTMANNGALAPVKPVDANCVDLTVEQTLKKFKTCITVGLTEEEVTAGALKYGKNGKFFINTTWLPFSVFLFSLF